MNQTEKPKCNNCGAEMAFNPKTNKMFCSAKCWLNSNQPQQAQQYNKPITAYKAVEPKKFDNSSYYVAYAKDLVVAMLSLEANKNVSVEVLMEAAIKVIKQAQEAFK